MKIKVWGCRGSLATPGPGTLRYGGNTTCLEIRDNAGTLVVVDAGSGIRQLGKYILANNHIQEIALLFTHAHLDHLVGFPFFTPAYFSRYTIRLCGGSNAQGSIKKYLSREMEGPFFPVDFNVMKANFIFDCDRLKAGQVGAIRFESIPLRHPNGTCGYKFMEDGKTFAFLTDNELGASHADGLDYDAYVAFCRGADLLFHDAQYTDEEYKTTRGWGHTTYADAVDFALKAGVKQLGIVHHDPDRDDDDLDRQVAFCRKRIAAAGGSLECFAAAEGMEIRL